MYVQESPSRHRPLPFLLQALVAHLALLARACIVTSQNPPICVSFRLLAILWTQMQSRLHADQFESLVETAQKGCMNVYSLLAGAVSDRLESVATR